MPASIGFRAYRVTAHKRRDREIVPLGSGDFDKALPALITDFISNHAESVRDNDRERSLYFDERESGKPGCSKGYVRYGTYGFESKFVNNKTRKENYHRKVDDVEEIPLFYEFWWPDNSDHGLMIFQSFQGRSCIGILMELIQKDFEEKNRGHILKFNKLLPNSSDGKLYSKAPVKRIRLIKRNASSDLADRYIGQSPPNGVNIEVCVSARRSSSLGEFGKILNLLPGRAGGVALHDGIEFNEAFAEIKIGKRTRRVGVFGTNSDAGVIDISEDVTRGSDGHPTYDSLTFHSNEILLEFHKILSGKSP